MNSKEEKQLVSSRWNDCSTMSIIHTPTEEERKKATDEMVDNLIKNIKKFADNEREDEGKEEGQISLIIIHVYNRMPFNENIEWHFFVLNAIVRIDTIYKCW